MTPRQAAVIALLLAGAGALPASGAPGAPVVVVGQRAPQRATAGDLVPVVVRVANRGRATARDVRLVATLPERTAFAGGRAGARVQGGRATWRLGDLAPGRSRTVRYALRADSGARGLRCATVAAFAANASHRWGTACVFLVPRARPARPPVTG